MAENASNVGSAEGERALDVDAAAEGQAVAEVLLEALGCHAHSAHLHGVENVHPSVDEIGDDRADRAAGVHEHLLAVAMHRAEDPLVARQQKRPEHVGRDHERLLCAQVVVVLEHVDAVRRDVEHALDALDRVDGQNLHEPLREVRPESQVHEQLLAAPQLLRVHEDSAGYLEADE